MFRSAPRTGGDSVKSRLAGKSLVQATFAQDDFFIFGLGALPTGRGNVVLRESALWWGLSPKTTFWAIVSVLMTAKSRLARNSTVPRTFLQDDFCLRRMGQTGNSSCKFPTGSLV